MRWYPYILEQSLICSEGPASLQSFMACKGKKGGVLQQLSTLGTHQEAAMNTFMMTCRWL